MDDERLTQDERAVALGNLETGILATLQACMDDATAVQMHIKAFDLPPDVLMRALGESEAAANCLRAVRDESDMSIRAEAREAIAKLG